MSFFARTSINSISKSVKDRRSKSLGIASSSVIFSLVDFGSGVTFIVGMSNWGAEAFFGAAADDLDGAASEIKPRHIRKMN